ncbi:MAG: thrombospondin type 3 repeat-containing protein [bacterium]
MITQPIGQRAQPEVARTTAQELESKLADQEHQTGKAVKFRRQQRWVFYAVITLFFIFAIFIIVKVYNDNSKLLADVNNINLELTQKKTDLDNIKQSMTEKDRALQAADANLGEVQAELAKKTENLQTIVEKNDELGEELNQIKILLDSAESNVTNLILEIAIKLDAKEINRIALADVQPDTLDSDGDGLSDDLEQAINTDMAAADSDNDGYSDKEEVIGGFNPNGDGKLNLSSKIADNYKGKILLQDAYAWYVGQNGKKYFLGSLDDKFNTMRENKYWSRNN